MKSIRLPAHRVLQLLQGSATHHTYPLYTPDGTLVPTDISAVPDAEHAEHAGQTFHFPDETLVLYPPAAPGTNICVKERWRVGAWKNGCVAIDYAADGYARREWLPVRESYLAQLIRQSRADLRQAGHTPDEHGHYSWIPGQAPTRWRLPSTMRIGMSRLAAVVASVRPVRLSALTEQDALDAGMGRVSEAWMLTHYPDYVRLRDRLKLDEAAQEAYIQPPIGPTPLMRLHAEIRRRHHLPPGQDAWIWATTLTRLDETPLAIRKRELAQADAAAGTA